MLKAPTATQRPAPARTNSPGTQKPAQPSIPFTRAARRKTQLSFTAGPVVLGANQVQIGPIQIPAAGYLRYLEVTITGTTAANAAVVTFAADAPWNVIAFLSVTNAAGDTIVVPITGYHLMLMNKWGALAEDPPFCDPRLSGFTVTTGVGGGLGGSFSFTLRIPMEIDPHDAFCAVPNLAANKAYQVQLMFAPNATIYGVTPTTPPSVSVTGIAHFWTQPNPVNGVGTPQEVAPLGAGSVSMWRLQTIPVTQGDKIFQLTNVGNVIRTIIYILRTAAGARTSADIPATWQIVLNNDTLFYLPDGLWSGDMQSSYGYTAAGADAAATLDTGVRALHYFMEQNGRVRCDAPRDQWLPTLDATLLQTRGTSFGAAAATLEVLTNEIKPVSAAALYNIR